MKELTQIEVSQVGGGDAGVPHTDYYYGEGKSWFDKAVDAVLDLICRDGARC
jgi:hypothetical protein